MPVATRFATAFHLTRHYVDHGNDFGLTCEADYEEAARGFFNKPIVGISHIEERQRTRGGVLVDEWVRYDRVTNEFGVVSSSGIIKTYFKPIKSPGPPGTPLRKMHFQPTHYDYFVKECTKP